MFAIGFDLNVAATSAAHPRGVSQAYSDVGAVLNRYGFSRIPGSVYVSQGSDFTNFMKTP